MTKANNKFFTKDFWIKEADKYYRRPTLRLEKCARLINSIKLNTNCDLLDVGCGPATLEKLLNKEIHYYGIDIAIHDPASNLLEVDLIKKPIKFEDKKFDIVVAAGFFEYMGEYQQKKLTEIHEILKENGKFIVSYTNFNHVHAVVYDLYNNIISINEFKQDLNQLFNIDRFFPIYHNWKGTVPQKKWSISIQRYMNFNIPLFSPRFAISYFFVCSPK